MRKYISVMLAAAVSVSAYMPFSMETTLAQEGTTTEITYNYGGDDHTRQMETLDRGLVAVNTDDGVFLSWRLLGSEGSVSNISAAADFEVYRDGEKIADVDDSTNYLDTGGGIDSKYSVSVSGGDRCDEVSVLGTDYIEIALDKPEDETIYYPENMGGESIGTYDFFPADASCGDLDGDGEYEIIIKWVSEEKDVGKAGDPAYSGTVRLAAYDINDGRIWDYDIELGRNVYSSAHTVQFLVYDLDGDGKAEITCQTSLGSKDAEGNYVSNAADPASEPKISMLTDEQNENADYRGGGLIITGEEFLTVFNGETGEAIDTIDLPTARVSAETFGDNYGNRCNRFLADVAYLDGERPYAVYWRGYYHGNNGQQRTSVCGVSFDGERLSCDYRFDTLDGQPGYVSGNEAYVGQGNHNITTADVDNDGKDELISGAMCLEATENSSDLAVKWCTFLGHGDAMHIGDYDPTHDGLEFFTVHEEATTLDYGMSVIDPASGQILHHVDGSNDTGRGIMANFGIGGYYQIGCYVQDAGGEAHYEVAYGNDSFSESPTTLPLNFRIFWDGDLYDEALDGTNLTSWNGRRWDTVFNAKYYGCVSVNGSKANPSLQADLFGDWREELVYPTSDGTALRIFTTTDVTEYKLPTLMHDPVYRSGVAAEQTAYNQPPHVGFCLSEELFEAKPVSLEITSTPDKIGYEIGEQLDTTGLTVTAFYEDGTSETVTGYTVSGFDPYAAGTQRITVNYMRLTAVFDVNVNTGFEIDSQTGLITGYSGSDIGAILPSSIDGVIVTGFADEALKESALADITVYTYGLTIGRDVFPEGITIICPAGSDIYDYAIENGINVKEPDDSVYTFNITYSENGYEGFSMLQGGEDQTRTIGYITYGVGGRTDPYYDIPAGDMTSGFELWSEEDGNDLLYAGIGQFASSNRNAYMTIEGLPALSDETDSVFETDILIHNGDGQLGKMTVSDQSGIVDTVSASVLGLETDTWYNYKLICHRGTYYRVIADMSGAVISKAALGNISSEYPANSIAFLQESNNFTDGQHTYMLLDNTKAYTGTEVCDTVITVTDAQGDPIQGAEVTVDGDTYTSGSDGNVSLALYTGVNRVTVSAEGYASKVSNIGAYRNGTAVTVTLEDYVPLTGIGFVNDTLELDSGTDVKLEVYAVPSNASEQEVSFESSDTSVVTVDDKGTVTAKQPGTAVITASSTAYPEITAQCTVTVRAMKVDGSKISVYYRPDGAELYAAMYENDVLTQLARFDLKEEIAEYDAGFEPDKVFLWGEGMIPIDMYTR